MIGYQARAIRHRGARPQEWVVDGWQGMYDALSNRLDPQEAELLVNFLPNDVARGGSLYLRNGRQRFDNPNPALEGDVAGGTPNRCQWIGQVEFPDRTGAGLTLAVVGGEVFLLDAAISTGGTWTKVLTQADITGAGAALSQGGSVIAIGFSGQVVFVTSNVTGSPHKPWAWDGSTVGGGITLLSNAPSDIFISLAVYYGKLFLLSRDQKTIYWSEENQINTGYTGGGFNNAWDISVMTGLANAKVLIGTNEALYVLRAGSITAIRGAVSSTFSTDGTVDGIFQGAGCDASTDACYINNTLFWFDNSEQKWAYRPGVGVVRLSDQFPRKFGYDNSVNHSMLSIFGITEHTAVASATLYQCYPDYANQRVYFSGAATGDRRVVFVFDAQTLKLLTTKVYPAENGPFASNGFRHAWITLVDNNSGWVEIYIDENGYPFIEHISSRTGGATQHSDEDEAGNETAITGMLIGPMHGWQASTEWQFTRLDVVAVAFAANNLSVGYLTSSMHKDSLNNADQSFSDSGLSNTPYERRTAFGLAATGRWLRPIIKLTGVTSGESSSNGRMELLGYRLVGYPLAVGTPAGT